MQFSPVLPTPPVQPRTQPYYPSVLDLSTFDSATVYITITASGTDIYDPGCLIIGDGEAQLRWTTSDDFLRWLGSDADLRWDARLRLGTGEC